MKHKLMVYDVEENKFVGIDKRVQLGIVAR